MRRRIALAAAALALAGSAATAAGGAGAATPERAAKPGAAIPSRLLVTAREFGLSLSRPKLRPGPAIVQLYDYGEDPHNLLLQRVGGTAIWNTGVIEPGETGEVRLRLRKQSRYTLWCSLADHAELGMTAELKVGTKKKRKKGKGGRGGGR